MRIAFVFSDKVITQFMQHADVFESFKVVVKNSLAILNVDSWGLPQTEAIIKKTAEQSDYGLVACFGIDEVYYIDPAVKIVSTGSNWAMIEEYVQYYQGKLALENDKNCAWHVGIPNE